VFPIPRLLFSESIIFFSWKGANIDYSLLNRSCSSVGNVQVFSISRYLFSNQWFFCDFISSAEQVQFRSCGFRISSFILSKYMQTYNTSYELFAILHERQFSCMENYFESLHSVHEAIVTWHYTNKN
jgi:hypothetical protein